MFAHTHTHTFNLIDNGLSSGQTASLLAVFLVFRFCLRALKMKVLLLELVLSQTWQFVQRCHRVLNSSADSYIPGALSSISEMLLIRKNFKLHSL